MDVHEIRLADFDAGLEAYKKAPLLEKEAAFKEHFGLFEDLLELAYRGRLAISASPDAKLRKLSFAGRLSTDAPA